MHLRMKGTALISTVIILSLVSILGCAMYRMMKSNLELTSVYYIPDNLYDIEKDEEDILYDFMEKINEDVRKAKEDDSEYKTEDLFDDDFTDNINKNYLQYNKEKDELTITIFKKYQCIRRILKYNIEDEKIVLIPTYKFEILKVSSADE